jgi:hypothetical protein
MHLASPLTSLGSIDTGGGAARLAAPMQGWTIVQRVTVFTDAPAGATRSVDAQSGSSAADESSAAIVASGRRKHVAWAVDRRVWRDDDDPSLFDNDNEPHVDAASSTATRAEEALCSAAPDGGQSDVAMTNMYIDEHKGSYRLDLEWSVSLGKCIDASPLVVVGHVNESGDGV